jgi:hypothetical protein
LRPPPRYRHFSILNLILLDASQFYRLADVDRLVLLSKTRPPSFFPFPITTGARANQDSVKWLALKTLLLFWIEARYLPVHDWYKTLLFGCRTPCLEPLEQVSLMSTFGARVIATITRTCCLEPG